MRGIIYLMELTEREKQSDRYHAKVKGCTVVFWKREVYDHAHIVETYRCEEHGKELCRCGWERGWHYGTESKSL